MALSHLILLAAFGLLLTPHIAEAQSAPAPESGPVNLTEILDKGGQYTTLIRLLTSTQVANQINSQINSSTQGMTVFAPTDNAFNNLKSGALNNLDNQEQVQLILYHVLPQFYTLSNLFLVSNPVRTQATGKDGVWGLNFTGQNNQLNVSTGVVETQVNNALRQTFPLAVYESDKVLLPEELFGNKTSNSTLASTPTSSTAATKNSTSTAAASGPSSDTGASGEKNVALRFVLGFFLVCMGLLS